MNELIVSYGAGTNSTAMVIGLLDNGIRPYAIVFSDTGGERPETYRFIEQFSHWLVKRGGPSITTIRYECAHETLEAECLAGHRLPGLAYGFRSCSDKWKQRPFKRWLKAQTFVDPLVCIGFDADEPHRAERAEQNDSPYRRRYPLIEWDWGRDECIEVIKSAGIPPPGKSSCFFCPASRKPEILDLRDRHPDLLERALRMERNAELTSVKGLGRRFAWQDYINSQEPALDTTEMPCGCYDG